MGSGGLEEVRVRVRADNQIPADQKTAGYTDNFNHIPGQPAIATSTTRAALQLHINKEGRRFSFLGLFSGFSSPILFLFGCVVLSRKVDCDVC